MPHVSVVITTFNRSRMLPSAIESAKKAATNAEVIVVDDCSTDDTPEICADIPGIRYIRLNTNRGLAHARNVGINESSSEFIAFLDDDDLRLPNSIDKQLCAISVDENIALCYGQALIGDARRQLPTGEIYPFYCPQGDIFWELLEDNIIPMPSVLARKSRLLGANGFDPDLKLTADWDMWLRLSEESPVAAVAEPVAIYRKASAASEQMCSNSAALVKEALKVQQSALNRPRARVATGKQRRHVQREFRNRVYEILMASATNSIYEGNARSARANVFDALRYRPIKTVATGRLLWLLTRR